MGARGQQMGICVEKGATGKGHNSYMSDLRSAAKQRRLVCVALFVALVPFAITRSYLFYSNPDAPSESPRFFAGDPAPAALHDEPFRENVPRLTKIISSNSSSSGIQIDNNPDPEPNSADKTSRNSSEAKANDLEMGKANLGERNPGSLNSSANSTSGFEIGTGNGKNVSRESPSSPAVNSSSGYSDNLLKERFENNTMVIEMEGAKNTSSLLNSKGDCNLEQGKWVPDFSPPMYNGSTCRYIQPYQNCMKNGRPDVGYLYWKWQPHQCELPRINPTAFLTAMRNRSIVFAGDSIARNQFQSLLCTLSQVEDPKNTYHTQDDRNNVYLFPSFNFTLAIYWSPYLVRVEDKATTWPDNDTRTDIIQTVPHIYLDELDKNWVKGAVGADILQLSTGQWWYKKAMYVEKRKAIGCHGCSKEFGLDKPYNKAIANILKGSLSVPGFNGTTVYRSFGPEHFEGGDWDTGGACPRTTPGGAPMNFLTEWMYGIQKRQFKNVTGELGVVAKDRLKLLGITDLAQIRADGHPNVYRAPADKKSDRRPNGIPNDCLHWCLPGPIDTWNDILVEILYDIILK